MYKTAVTQGVARGEAVLEMLTQKGETLRDWAENCQTAQLFATMLVLRGLRCLLLVARNCRRDEFLQRGMKALQMVSVNGRQREIVGVSGEVLQAIAGDREVPKMEEKVKTIYLRLMETMRGKEHLVPILKGYSLIEQIMELVMSTIEDGRIEEAMGSKARAQTRYSQAQSVVEIVLEEYRKWDETSEGEVCRVVYRPVRDKLPEELDDSNAYYLAVLRRLLLHRAIPQQ